MISFIKPGTRRSSPIHHWDACILWATCCLISSLHLLYKSDILDLCSSVSLARQISWNCALISGLAEISERATLKVSRVSWLDCFLCVIVPRMVTACSRPS